MSAAITKPARNNDVSTSMEMDVFLQPSVTQRATYLEPSSFLPFLPFAFWLLDINPAAQIVSLGLRDAVAHFAFCQAIALSGHPCQLHGFAQAEPGAAAYNAATYPDISTFNYGPPLKQAHRFTPGSIDLLHIDLDLTAATTKTLTRNWLPLLSDRGVILLHNTDALAENKPGAAFLAQLVDTAPVIRLNHGGGMLLALIGKTQPDPLRHLAENDAPSARLILARLGATHSDDLHARTLAERSKDARSQVLDAQRHVTRAERSAEKARAAYNTRGTLIAGLRTRTFEAEVLMASAAGQLHQMEAHRTQNATLNGQVSQLQAQMAVRFEELAILTRHAEDQQSEIAKLKDTAKQLVDAKAALKKTESKLSAMQKSASWKITGPMRRVIRLVKGTKPSAAKKK